jgi:GNAT superfamily N-acetyltransferase
VDNLERMIRLAEEFFDMKNDPDQLSVDGESMARLREIHPDTMLEEKDERELLDRTPSKEVYDALYLCSALVLPEHRGKGLAGRLAARAVRSIQETHPIRSLFYWGFSAEGDRLAASLARECGLPLHRRNT